MTLHMHKVDDGTQLQDASQPVEMPAGWEVAPRDADSIRVCGAYRWQTQYLVLADGNMYGTAMNECSHLIGGCGKWLLTLRGGNSKKLKSRLTRENRVVRCSLS